MPRVSTNIGQKTTKTHKELNEAARLRKTVCIRVSLAPPKNCHANRMIVVIAAFCRLVFS
jgi:hypothetical protein